MKNLNVLAKKRNVLAENQNVIAGILALVGLAAIVIAYFLPIWWVSLTAPQYPEEAFPDGIRIHFHFDRVANGCKAAGAGTRMAGEIIQGDLSHETERWNPILDAQKNVDKGAEGLDCVHEMNIINHYVGMFPIETGAPVERPLAKFFFGFFAVMIVAFVLPCRWVRLAWLCAGFLAVAAWMIMDQLMHGQLDVQVQDYVREAGRFFKEPDRIAAWGENVRIISLIVIFGLIASMGIVVAGVAKTRNFQLLLVAVPALLPLFFLITYSGWLWYFGHNLHPWGSFTVKPFMPTVFGEGEVAQFLTYSYPTWGFALLMLAFICLGLALLIRRKQLREHPDME
ncbi:MAG: hypothetical protein LBE22_08445 [Azoarcus sp.]|jgi:hypothetical protein|nr:hypothetical protein [Azoarcus sp.]